MVQDWKLQELLKECHTGKNKILIFGLYKKEAARLEETLKRKGWKVGSIHGDKGQGDRSRALQDFKDGKVPILVATDVAARGLDIPNVEVRDVNPSHTIPEPRSTAPCSGPWKALNLPRAVCVAVCHQRDFPADD